jgi:TP901 family phage tail tape measure protein
MADAQQTIDLIFNGVDKTGAATMAALGNAEKFTASLQNVTQPIADISVGAVKLEAGLLAAGLAMTTFAVTVAGDFDAAFRQLSTIIDASDEQLDTFRQAILDYAGGSTQALDAIMDSLGAAIGSGVDYADSIGLVAAAEKLAVATKADLASTTKVLVSTLNSYGMEVEDVGKLSDVFFAIIDDGDISMNDLAESFAKVAPVAKLAGVPIEEVGAAIATLTAAGIKPAESIEAVRAAIGNIIAPSQQATDLAEQLGIEFNAAGLQADGLAGLLATVAEKTGGNAEQMKILFGSINGFTAAATLAGPQADAFAKTLASMQDVAGATDEAFAKMAGSVELGGQKIANSLTALLVAIGDPLLDEFGGMADAVAEIFNALTASVAEGGLGELVAYIESVFADLQAAVEAVAKNLPAALEQADFGSFQKGIEAVIAAFDTLFAGIDITTVDGLTKAIELAGAAFLGLSNFTAGVIESFKPLFDILVKMGSEIDGANLDWLTFAGNIGGAVTQFNKLLGVLGPLADWLGAVAGLLVGAKGVGMVGSLAATAVEAGKLAFVLGGAAGLVGYIGALAVPVGAITVSLLAWKDAQEKLTEAQKAAEGVQERAADTLERFAETTGIAVGSIDEASKLIDDGTVVWDEATQGWVAAGKAMSDASAAAADAVNPYEEANQAMIDAAVASEKLADGTAAAGAATKEATTYTMQIVPVLDAATGKITGYEQRLVATAGAGKTLAETTETMSGKLATSADVMTALGKKTDLTNDQLITLAKNVREAEIELEKIASNERIKFMEFRVQLDIAQLEANAKIVTATFESLNATMESTGEVIGDALGALGAVEGFYGLEILEVIEQQLEIENKLRQEAAELQKDLTRATIEQLEAQTRAMDRGDALIKIDGAGLQPHLEAFMWEILRAIQVRVNADGLAMLLGA